MGKLIVALTAATALGATVPAAGQAPSLGEETRRFVVESSPVVVLRNARLIDGTGAPIRAGQTIVIRDGRFVAVGDPRMITEPTGAAAHDLAGATVIPGLIDLHAHQYFFSPAGLTQMAVSAPRLYLGGGVTTVRTAGAQMPYDEINTKRDIDRGLVPGPRMHISGPYLDGPGTGPGRNRRLESPEEARRVVAYWASEGATWLKFSGNVSRAVLQAAIEEAHRHEMGVTGHLCSVSFREAATLGIDNLEHGFITNSDWVPGREPDKCHPENMRFQERVDLGSPGVDSTIATLLAEKVSLTSTLSVYELFVPGRAKLSAEALDALAPHTRAAAEEALEATNQRRVFTVAPVLFEKMMAFERKWVEAGGLLAAGVDPWGNGSLPGYGDHRNYELLVEAGFAPEVALKIVSANGAAVLRILDDLGTISVGKRADLAILDGDPVARPADIGKVRLVFKDGVGYDAVKLRQSVRGMVGVR
ncbi:MAG: amidohydrolase family protein [Gemmatimonadetes bacterium]|nr:amidohydrolase family protein [Gemmatimonadota bacterium]